MHMRKGLAEILEAHPKAFAKVDSFLDLGCAPGGFSCRLLEDEYPVAPNPWRAPVDDPGRQHCLSGRIYPTLGRRLLHARWRVAEEVGFRLLWRLAASGSRALWRAPPALSCSPFVARLPRDRRALLARATIADNTILPIEI